MNSLGSYPGNVISFFKYSFQHLVCKAGRGQIWLQKGHASREEALLSRLLFILSPGFPGSSSVLQHLIDLAVLNLVPKPEAIHLDERRSRLGASYCKAAVSCCTGECKHALISVIRSGLFGMRNSVCLT